MENENRNGNKVLLTVIGAATFLTAMIGATFAYFSATHTSEEKTITTAQTALSVTATNNEVTNIRPTTWAAASKDTDSEIVKMTVNVSGTTTASGKYSLYFNQPAVTIGNRNGDTGAIADFKWAAYDSEGNQIVAPTAFTSSATALLIPGDGLSGYTKAFTGAANTSTANINDTYYVYVWIENRNADQNNLQEVNFNVNFTASATTAS